jgi:4-azaleucine resistance transporter AzlC
MKEAEHGRREWLEGARDTLPFAASAFALAIGFGVLARTAALTVAESSLMSALVFAGSAQFAALPLLSAWATPATIIATTAAINLRHLLMGASLTRVLQGVPRRFLAAVAFGLTDETYALVMSRAQHRRLFPAYVFGSFCAMYVGWNAGTALGAALGALIGPPERYGLDFAVTAVFIALLTFFLEGRPAWTVLGAAAAISIGGVLLLPSNSHLIAAGLGGSLVGAALERR